MQGRPELAVLGVCLLGEWEYALDRLNENDFCRPVERRLFQAIVKCAEKYKKVDLALLSPRLQDEEMLLALEATALPLSFSSAEQYVDILLEESAKRGLTCELQDAINTMDREDAVSIISTLDDALHGATARLSFERTASQDCKSVARKALAFVRSRREGEGLIQTGFVELDDILAGGLAPEQLIYVAGRPGMGKTTLAASITLNVAIRRKPAASVLFVSAEMSAEQIMVNMISSLSKVPAVTMRAGTITDQEMLRVQAYGESVANSTKLGFFDGTPVTTARIRREALRYKEKHGLDLLVVDYLQVLSLPDTGNRVQDVGMGSLAMKQMTRELNCPIICLSQLSRAVEQRKCKRPVLSDLRDSGSLEQDADTVLFVYRDEYYNGVVLDEKTGHSNAGKAEVIVAKNRYGSSGGACELLFDGPTYTFHCPLQKKLEDG